MRRIALAPIICVLALGACASPDAAPICDGHHRRPVNLHGSGLDAPLSAPAEFGQGPAQTFGSC